MARLNDGPAFEFDEAVSLGGWCQVTAQLRRRGLQCADTSYFFDWLITPLQALHDCLQIGIQDAGHDAYPHGGTAIGSTTGLRYHHEFERDVKGNCIIEGKEAVHDRLSRRWQRITALDGKRLLFVRLGGWLTENSGYHTHVDEQTLYGAEMDRTAELVAKRFPNSQFRLLWAYFDGPTVVDGKPTDPRINLCRFTSLAASEHYSDADSWLGDDAEWDRALLNYVRSPIGQTHTDCPEGGKGRY